MRNKMIGATLLITGTTIGAGMLALPMISGVVGFPVALLILTAIWGLMTFTGLLILEVNLSLPVTQNSFISMAKSTVGSAGVLATSVSVALLLYSLTGAYISGSSSLLTILFSALFNIKLPSWALSCLFTLTLGSVVWISTHAVDKFNRVFFTAKGVFLIFTLALLLPKIQPHFLISTPLSHHSVLLIAPVFLTSFGYHTIIPSLTKYLGKEVRTLRNAILIGTALPFVIYVIWLISTLGVIPQTGASSFSSLAKQNDVKQLTLAIMHYGHSNWISFGMNCFANVAVVTSFFGVTLGLFDMIADSIKAKNDIFSRLKTACITFLPPLAFSLFYPHGFLIALSAAAIFVSFLEVILPAWMAIKSRRTHLSPMFVAPGGIGLLYTVIVIGLAFIISGFFNL